MAVIRQRREAAERERLANLAKSDPASGAAPTNNWLTADNTVKPKFEEVSSSSESESDSESESESESEEEEKVKPAASSSSSSSKPVAAKAASSSATAPEAKPAKEKEKKEKGGDKLDKLPKFTSIEIKKMSGDQLKVKIIYVTLYV